MLFMTGRQFVGGIIQIVAAFLMLAGGVGCVVAIAVMKVQHRVTVYHVVGFFGALFTGIIGQFFWNWGRSLDVISAEELAERDSRPCVLYLRSFEFDSTATRELNFAPPIQDAMLGLAVQTLTQQNSEEILAGILHQVGPGVAVGKPGNERELNGFARKKLAMESWQETVASMMQEAALVVICTGNTIGVLWELQKAREHVPLERLLILITRETNEEWWNQADRIFGQPIPRFAPHPEQAIHGLIYFDEEGQAHDRLLIPFEAKVITEHMRPLLDRVSQPKPIPRY
jgi:hypothetical protein